MPRESTCRRCGKRILWRPTANGKWWPANLDGSPHRPTCERAARAAGHEAAMKFYEPIEPSGRAAAPEKRGE